MTSPDLFPVPMPGGGGHAVALARAGDDDVAAARAIRRALCAAYGPAAHGWTAPRRPGAARALVRADGSAVAATLSLSHREGRAAALVAPAGWRVGVDLERRDAVDAAHARHFLDRAEREVARTLGLAALWALKEAAWKALALDASTPFGALRWRFDDRAGPVAVVLEGRPHAVTARLAVPWPGWVLAAVWMPPVGAAAGEVAA